MLPPRARQSPVSPDACNLTRAIDLIGDRWSLLVLRSAMYGVRRFDDFQKELEAPRTVLAGRLKKLTDAGLLERKSYREPGKRARSEYVLSEMGQGLRPILIGLTQWGDRWLSEATIPPISFASRTGSAVRASFVDNDGKEVRPDAIRVTLRKTGR